MARFVIAWAIVCAGVVSDTASQQAGPPKNITTSSGVYTPPQAARGEQTYMNLCVSCHPKGTYTAAAFREKWNGTALSELYMFVSTSMPKMDPGTLEPEEYAQVIAYLLKINGMPAGKSELPADTNELRKIRIWMPVDNK